AALGRRLVEQGALGDGVGFRHGQNSYNSYTIATLALRREPGRSGLCRAAEACHTGGRPEFRTMALILPQERLEELRRRLQASGRRPSMLFATTSPAVLEAIQLVEEFGPMCEALYLVMVADGRLLNVEREVLRGALDVLSAGRIRTAHMESMLDNAARRIAEHGAEALLNNVIGALEEDPARAEATVVLAIAVAAADGS